MKQYLPIFTRENLIYTSCIIGLFLLVLYRAFCIDITFDEVYTIDLASQSIVDILFDERNFQSANNHILNTVLIKPFLFLFGKKMMAIRLPSVLASLFFFIGNKKLAGQLCSTTPGRISAFLILSLSLYVFDFFSLSRGYGLALMFEVWSLYYFFRFLQNGQLKNNALCFVFAGLAILSNFTWINFFLPLWGTLQVIYLMEGKSVKHWLRLNSWPTFIAIILFFICYIPISYLKDADEFRWGTSDWWSSMQTASAHINYSNDEGFARGLRIFLVITFVIGFLVSFIHVKRMRHREMTLISDKILKAIIVLISFVILSSVAQHVLLQTMYMDGRKATMYTTLIICLVILVWQKITGSFAIRMLAIYAVISFFYHIQLNGVREWYLDRYIEEALNMMKLNAKGPISITCSWELQTPLEFYNRYYEGSNLLLHKVEKKESDVGDSYWYITSTDMDKLPSGYKMIARYDNQTFLYMRK